MGNSVKTKNPSEAEKTKCPEIIFSFINV